MSKIILLIVIVALVVYALKRAGVGSKGAAENREEGQRFLDENKQRDGVTETASGLQYEVLKLGSGERHPSSRDKVLVHYHGTLIDGTVFDSSVQRNQPIAFGLNQVISGWTEGLQLMTEGEKARLYIPADLAYRNQRAGTIPPGSTLIFEVELLEIQS
ncbi:MAG: peptidylprolyl isomerase [Oleibacter sp.]|nr:peptidylprolyl isomerase [Thalassolituus sp.]|tara:strand:- start:352 stop:828 length:477 start_codon:yes stop_codon:yes gene_type:complete